MSILLHPPPPHKTCPPRCPCCRATLGADGNCPPCIALCRREEAGRARRRRAELIERMAVNIGAKPDEVIELIESIAQGGAA